MKYDIAISYASENRDYVARVVRILELEGFSVFFAEQNQEMLTASNLLETLYPIYKWDSLFIAAFISESYLKKDYTMQEASIALTRSREERRNCLIPICFGNARLPDLNPDIVYLSGEKKESETAYYIAQVVRGYRRNSGNAPSPNPDIPPVSKPPSGRTFSNFVMGDNATIIQSQGDICGQIFPDTNKRGE